ncbi:Transposon Tf2-9 polyprotein [Thelohanellus kitauei]|uniref:Transposon Tf2-9 polyprotein n=1 Tax=Thelohanellus kitauei TaxID=669202 RepID=A0A0C2MWC5_THEKT|nr:Transposon Tf2-9 polyprotein [Thelohanellus kitauei]
MAKAGAQGLKEILQRVADAEAVIARGARDKLQREQDEPRDVTSRNFSYKFCSYCRSRTHNTRDCFKKPDTRAKEYDSRTRDYDPKNNHGRSQEKNNYIIMEERSRISSIELDIELQNISSVALIDTGSQFSYISREFCIKNAIHLQKVALFEITCANNTKYIGSEMASLECRLNSSDISFKQEFRVFNNLTTETILGMDFMLDNDVKIDLKNKEIQVGGKTVSLVNVAQPEQVLIEKANLLKTDQNEPELTNTLSAEIRNIIKEYEDNNPGYNYRYDEIFEWQKGLNDHNLNVKNLEGYAIKFDSRMRMIITDKFADIFIKKIHLDLGHPGGRSLIGILKHYVAIDDLSRRCYRLTKSCTDCQESKSFNPRLGKILGGIYSDTPFAKISTDIVGPYESSNFITDLEGSKFWILTFSDICTRFSKTYVLEKPNSENICHILVHEWIKDFGKPQTIVSDQGKPYISKTYRNLLKSMNISESYTSTYNPTANGISERINSTISTVLRICQNQDLSKSIMLVNTRLNCSFHRILNTTPFELKYNYAYLDPLKRQVNKLEEAKQRTLHNIQANEDKVNESRNCTYKYKVNSKVYVRSTNTGKLDPRYEGPFQVLDVKDNRLFLKVGNREEWVNIKRIKPYLEDGGEDVVPCTTMLGKTRNSEGTYIRQPPH